MTDETKLLRMTPLCETQLIVTDTDVSVLCLAAELVLLTYTAITVTIIFRKTCTSLTVLAPYTYSVNRETSTGH